MRLSSANQSASTISANCTPESKKNRAGSHPASDKKNKAGKLPDVPVKLMSVHSKSVPSAGFNSPTELSAEERNELTKIMASFTKNDEEKTKITSSYSDYLDGFNASINTIKNNDLDDSDFNAASGELARKNAELYHEVQPVHKQIIQLESAKQRLVRINSKRPVDVKEQRNVEALIIVYERELYNELKKWESKVKPQTVDVKAETVVESPAVEVKPAEPLEVTPPQLPRTINISGEDVTVAPITEKLLTYQLTWPGDSKAGVIAEFTNDGTYKISNANGTERNASDVDSEINTALNSLFSSEVAKPEAIADRSESSEVVVAAGTVITPAVNLIDNESCKNLEIAPKTYLQNPADSANTRKLDDELNALKNDSSIPEETQSRIDKIATAAKKLGNARKILTEQEKAVSDYNSAHNHEASNMFVRTVEEKYYKNVRKEENNLAALLLNAPEEKSRGFAWNDYVARLETSSPNYSFSIKEFESSLLELSEFKRRLEVSLNEAKSEYGENSPLVTTIENVIKQRAGELRTEQAKYVEYSKLLLTDNVVDSYLKSRVTEDSRLGGGSLSLNEKLAVFVRLKNKLEKAINYTKLVEGEDSTSVNQLKQALTEGLSSYRAKLVSFYPEFGNKEETFELLLQLGETQSQLEVVNRANFNEANKNRSKITELESEIARLTTDLNSRLSNEISARESLEKDAGDAYGRLETKVDTLGNTVASGIGTLGRTVADELEKIRTESREAKSKVTGLETELGKRVTMPVVGLIAAGASIITTAAAALGFKFSFDKAVSEAIAKTKEDELKKKKVMV